MFRLSVLFLFPNDFLGAGIEKRSGKVFMSQFFFRFQIRVMMVIFFLRRGRGQRTDVFGFFQMFDFVMFSIRNDQIVNGVVRVRNGGGAVIFGGINSGFSHG